MTAIDKRRVWIGALVGGVVWNAWSMLLNIVFLAPAYAGAQDSGLLLKAPCYGFFLPVWLLMVFALAYVVALLYAAVRGTCGAGPKTALLVGALVSRREIRTGTEPAAPYGGVGHGNGLGRTAPLLAVPGGPSPQPFSPVMS